MQLLANVNSVRKGQYQRLVQHLAGAALQDNMNSTVYPVKIVGQENILRRRPASASFVGQERFPKRKRLPAPSARRDSMPVTLITYANPVQETSFLQGLSTVVQHALEALTRGLEERNAKSVFQDNIMMRNSFAWIAFHRSTLPIPIWSVQNAQPTSILALKTQLAISVLRDLE